MILTCIGGPSDGVRVEVTDIAGVTAVRDYGALGKNPDFRPPTGNPTYLPSVGFASQPFFALAR